MKRRFTETRGYGLVENGTFSRRDDHTNRVIEFLVGSHGKAYIIHVASGQYVESALLTVGFIPMWAWEHYKKWHMGMFQTSPQLGHMSAPEYMDKCPAGRNDRASGREYTSVGQLKRAFTQFCKKNNLRLVG